MTKETDFIITGFDKIKSDPASAKGVTYWGPSS